MKARNVFILLTVFALFPAGRVYAADGPGQLELEDRSGQYAASGAVFRDETGTRVRFGELLGKPAVVAPVYFGCTHSCPLLLNGLSDVLEKVEPLAGRDFTVITVSFDERDRPGRAREKKRDVLAAMTSPIADGRWRFLTGEREDILRFTGSIGFPFRPQADGFTHPVAIVVLAPDGRIVRYLTGVHFLPADLALALAEAADGRTGPVVRKALRYCYRYDPVRRAYVFDVLKVTGIAAAFFIGSFIAFLKLTGRKLPGGP